MCETNVNLAVIEPNIEAVINCEKLSDANKLLRITALVLRFIHKLKGKHCKTKTEYDDCLSSEEINSAEKFWIKHVRKTLSHEKTFTQTKVKLGRFVDDEGAQVEFCLTMTRDYLTYIGPPSCINLQSNIALLLVLVSVLQNSCLAC